MFEMQCVIHECCIFFLNLKIPKQLIDEIFLFINLNISNVILVNKFTYSYIYRSFMFFVFSVEKIENKISYYTLNRQMSLFLFFCKGEVKVDEKGQG